MTKENQLQLNKTLEDLDGIAYDDRCLIRYAEDVLIAVFNLCIDTEITDSSQMRYICNLLLINIGKIEICLSRHVGSFLRSDYEMACVVRSALKYILDDFAKIPIDWEETLEDLAYEVNLAEFDEKLDNYGPGGEDPNIDLDPAIVIKVPPSHWWWKKINSNDKYA